MPQIQEWIEWIDYPTADAWKVLNGLIPVEILGTEKDEVLQIRFSNGLEAQWYHRQDCCESVYINEVIGEWSDLIGIPLLFVEERVNPPEAPEFVTNPPYIDSYTWTFYTFRSTKGTVDVRWFGSSNGYYSERVNFQYMPAPPRPLMNT